MSKNVNVELMKQYASEINAIIDFDNSKGWYFTYPHNRNKHYFSSKKPLNEQKVLEDFFKRLNFARILRKNEEERKYREAEFDRMISEIPLDVIEKLKNMAKSYEGQFVDYFNINYY